MLAEVLRMSSTAGVAAAIGQGGGDGSADGETLLLSAGPQNAGPSTRVLLCATFRSERHRLVPGDSIVAVRGFKSSPEAAT